jgi:hypothetical protein
MHKSTLFIFNEKDHLPLKFYKPWVTCYRQLKQLVTALPSQISLQQHKQVREQQIQDLVNISPEKAYPELTPKPDGSNIHSASKNRGRLDDLLFSKERDDFLLSDYKRSNS